MHDEVSFNFMLAHVNAVEATMATLRNTSIANLDWLAWGIVGGSQEIQGGSKN